ncbi:MAG: lytic transglycosylase domain-containing protein [Caulobacteraceae bacterium]|nr:lytic transglycosylase domain-containing protein [Caulobacteraceae bacterium]
MKAYGKVLTALLIAGAAAPVTAQTTPSAPGYAQPMGYQRSSLSTSDSNLLRAALQAARSSDATQVAALRNQMSDPVARDLAEWALVDVMGERLGYFELDGARRDLSGWPRGDSRQAAAERALANSAQPQDPQRILDWFDTAPPQTAEGAITLASALQAKGQTDQAKALIKDWWRNRLFDLPVQERMLARYGSWLDQNDHIRRLDTLLLGPQGPAASAMLSLVPAEYGPLAEARRALRQDRADSTARFNAVSGNLASDPGLAFERARYLRKHGMDSVGMPLVSRFPSAPIDQESLDRIWNERKFYFNAAVRARNWSAAYAAMTNHGFPRGEPKVEAEFFAGWIALTRMRNPAQADRHFAELQASSSTPITQGRAAYWRGRAAEARGDAAAAQQFYQQGARYITAFYGQLAAEKAGVRTISLPRDPVPSSADRERFEGRDLVRAARMLAEIGERDLFKSFVLTLDDNLPNAEEYALLVDLARYYGDQDLSMKVARTAAQRGFILAERGYPVVTFPAEPGAAETAFALSIARQESNFWPNARSGANARGMMQLIPPTARVVARQIGVPYDEGSLYDASYNMRLGSYHLGDLIRTFNGSYVMAAAGYNAGPGRPPQWASECGDPRGGATDPLDFVECIPFSETRNYVMRTLETTQIYRARLNGGTAPLQLASDLKRGSYSYTVSPTAGQPSN